jgi:hypothetical protein
MPRQAEKFLEEEMARVYRTLRQLETQRDRAKRRVLFKRLDIATEGCLFWSIWLCDEVIAL